MSLYQLDADSLEMLAIVVAEGSFAAAARRLRLTRAAVSRRVMAIEDGLGSPLFQRSTRSLVLTDFGRALYVEARAVHEAARAARQAAKQARSGLSGTLRLSANTVFGRCCLVPLIARFRAEHRALHFDLQLTDRSVDLAAEGIDIAFRITEKPPLDCVATTVLRFAIGAYAAPGIAQQLAASGPLESPADLERIGTLLIGHDTTRIDVQWLAPDGAMHVFPARPAVQSMDVDALIDLAKAGGGIVCAPDFAVAAAVAQGALTPLLPGWRIRIPFGEQVLALSPPARYTGEKARQFLAFVKQELVCPEVR
jgi:DNA-binding transcriptional LysR family regulator